MTNMKKIL